MEIVKGKRTKRHRQYSPATAYFSDDKSVSSTQEDEDMANCLILLAQGFHPNQETEEEEEEEESNSIATDSYIYECKTCNRTFTSFQALGGHRASHKKPRIEPKEDKNVKRDQVKRQLSNSTLEEAKPVFSPLVIRASKVHECSICGSEFFSGQALGGHMRRHRVTPPQVKAPSSQSEKEFSDNNNNKTLNILSFDLNLPAPIEDDQNQVVESNFGFRTKNHLVFSSPPLVGCHY